MIDAATSMRARNLTRRHLRATIALGIFAGIAGGAAIGAWGIARRTASSFDRFVAYEDAANYHIMACPVGLDMEAPDAIERCARHDQADILEFVRALPGVDAAGRWSFAIAGVARPETPDEWASLLVPFPIDRDAVPSMGHPIVVDGRLADQDVATEVTINEELADVGRLDIGDQIVITVVSAGEFETAGEALDRPAGTSMTMDVVGIVRRPGDLTVRRVAGDASIIDSLARAEATQAYAQAIGDDFARYGIGVVVRSDSLTGEDIIAALEQRWPGRTIQLSHGSPSIASDPASVIDAIELQALGMHLLALVIGVAAVVFVGQAISRQTRREWADAETLSALGMTRRMMVSAALVRGLATAAVATVVALAVTVGVSPIGPTGVARKAETATGVAVDAVVLVVGLPLLAAVVLLFTAVPAGVVGRRRAAAETATHPAGAPTYLPPSFGVGWAMTRSRRAGGLAIGSAIAGVTLAAATGVAAWGLTTSYEHLLDTPQLYGAEWDAIVGNVSTETQAADSARRLAAIPGIRAVQILSLSGQQPDPAFAITSARPVVGEVSFGTVTRGRPPATSKEVALGADSMDEFGVDIGDDVSLPPGADDPVSFRVVGEVLVNDGFETRPGDGALVTPEAYDVIAAAGGDASTYAVWVDDDHDRTKTLAAVRDAFPTTYLEPRPPDKIANLQHVAAQPKLLTLVVGVLAGAALIHALAMSVTRSRRQIGVLKTLGFTRRQVISSVGWHATTIAAAALVVGIPLGVILGRLAWTAISQSIGVRVEHSLPAAAIGIVVGVVVVVANVAALVPGAAAARTRTALALRAE